ncbi:MAG TPA: hypothetical protein VHS99_22405, partial [Chloroflexota bacterium]|nr:hypothetical protein [Chloroflexota bacterium]
PALRATGDGVQLASDLGRGVPRRPFYMRRERRWKYIYYTGPGGEADPSDSSAPAPLEALYDPDADPGELTNLAADPAAAPLVAEQRERLLAFLRQQGVSDPAHPPLVYPQVYPLV